MEAITSPAGTNNITWMCENDHHGTRERATYAANGFTYNGFCSGMVMVDLGSRDEVPCACECHS